MISKNLKIAKQLLADGQLVAIPTETVYGLAGNAFDERAVAEIFRVKNRPSFDPLIVHGHSLEQIGEFVKEIPEGAKQLAKAFWPGPLTLLFPRNEKIPDLVTSGLPHVAVRIPNHPLVLELLQMLNFPLAAPSANPFGYVSPTTAQHVEDQLNAQISLTLDGGAAGIGVESTIVSFTAEQPEVLRKGGLPIEEIEKLIGEVNVREVSSSKPQAPGMLHAHYAPSKAKVILGDIGTLLPNFIGKTIATLSFGKKITGKHISHAFSLSEEKDLGEAARNLFGHLRELDRLSPEIILTQPVPDEGLGRAINDRLRRAAGK